MSLLLRLGGGVVAGAALHIVLSGRACFPRAPRRDERRLLALVVTGAAVEELVWHGPAFRGLCRRIGGAATTAATSPAFALWHGRSRRAEALELGTAGAAFAMTAIVGGWAAAAAAHVAYDLLVVLEAGCDR
jgi:membrane protease YdiL (CAAX protease family)